MARQAQLDIEEAQKSVKRINNTVAKMAERAKVLSTTLEETATATNMDSMAALSNGFKQVEDTIRKTAEAMDELENSTRKYSEDVSDIDAVDNSMYD